MNIDEHVQRLLKKYGKLPEKKPDGAARIKGYGKKSSVAEEGREES